MLAASIDDEQVSRLIFVHCCILELTYHASKSEAELSEPKSNAKMIIRRLDRNSEPQASIEADKYTIQYGISSSTPYIIRTYH